MESFFANDTDSNISDTPLISVGIPVYNSSRFLDQCLSSVLNQTYKHLEILIVYDFSEDETLNICQRYAKIDNRIKIVPNQYPPGIANARNTILDFVTGSFLFFVDSDDYLSSDAISTCFLARSKYQLDATSISGINFCFVSDTGKVYYPGKNKTKIFLQKNVLSSLLTGQFSSVVWGKLFPFSLFSGVRFDPSTGGNEDNNTMFLIYDRCGAFVSLSDRKYFFRNNLQSLTHQKNHYLIAAKTNEIMLQFAKTHCQSAVSFLRWRIAYFYINDSAERYLDNKNFVEFCTDTAKFKKWLFRTLFQVLFFFHITWREKLGTFAFCFSRRLFLSLRKKGLIC